MVYNTNTRQIVGYDGRHKEFLGDMYDFEWYMQPTYTDGSCLPHSLSQCTGRLSQLWDSQGWGSLPVDFPSTANDWRAFLVSKMQLHLPTFAHVAGSVMEESRTEYDATGNRVQVPNTLNDFLFHPHFGMSINSTWMESYPFLNFAASKFATITVPGYSDNNGDPVPVKLWNVRYVSDVTRRWRADVVAPTRIAQWVVPECLKPGSQSTASERQNHKRDLRNNFICPEGTLMPSGCVPNVWDQVVSNVIRQKHWEYAAPWKHSAMLNLPPTTRIIHFPFRQPCDFAGASYHTRAQTLPESRADSTQGQGPAQAAENPTGPGSRAGLRSAKPSLLGIDTKQLTAGDLELAVRDNSQPFLLGHPFDVDTRKAVHSSLLAGAAVDRDTFRVGFSDALKELAAGYNTGDPCTIQAMMLDNHPQTLRRIEAERDDIDMSLLMGTLPKPLTSCAQQIDAVRRVIHVVQTGLQSYQESLTPAPQIDTQLIITAQSPCQQRVGTHFDGHGVVSWLVSGGISPAGDVKDDGAKTWMLLPPDALPEDLLIKEGKENEQPQITPAQHAHLPWRTVKVLPGQVLVLPPGWWHQVTTCASGTFALNMMVQPGPNFRLAELPTTTDPTREELLDMLAAMSSSDDEGCTRRAGGAAASAAPAKVKSAGGARVCPACACCARARIKHCCARVNNMLCAYPTCCARG